MTHSFTREHRLVAFVDKGIERPKNLKEGMGEGITGAVGAGIEMVRRQREARKNPIVETAKRGLMDATALWLQKLKVITPGAFEAWKNPQVKAMFEKILGSSHGVVESWVEKGIGKFMKMLEKRLEKELETGDAKLAKLLWKIASAHPALKESLERAALAERALQGDKKAIAHFVDEDASKAGWKEPFVRIAGKLVPDRTVQTAIEKEYQAELDRALQNFPLLPAAATKRVLRFIAQAGAWEKAKVA